MSYLNTYQLIKQHFLGYLLAPLLVWLCCSAAWIDIALGSMPDSLRGKALILVAAALAALGWLFARFFRYVSAPKAIEFDFTTQQLWLDSARYAFSDLNYCLLTQKNRALKLELELKHKPAYAANGVTKTPQFYQLVGDASAFRAALTTVANIELCGAG